MNRIDRSTIVLGLTALLAVLALSVPVAAMNDPVTGRWMTRDPIAYDPGIISARAVDVRANDPINSPPRAQASTSGIMTAPTATVMVPWSSGASADFTDYSELLHGRAFEYLDSTPSCRVDPSGLLSWGTLCNCLGICRDCGWGASLHPGDWISIRSTKIRCCSPHFTPPSGWHYDCFSPAISADENCCCVYDFGIWSALHLICDVMPAVLK